MTARPFPKEPALGHTYTDGGQTWTWNGTQWVDLAADPVTNEDLAYAYLSAARVDAAVDFRHVDVTRLKAASEILRQWQKGSALPPNALDADGLHKFDIAREMIAATLKRGGIEP